MTVIHHAFICPACGFLRVLGDDLCVVCFTAFRAWARKERQLEVERRYCAVIESTEVQVAFDEWLERGRPLSVSMSRHV